MFDTQTKIVSVAVVLLAFVVGACGKSDSPAPEMEAWVKAKGGKVNKVDAKLSEVAKQSCERKIAVDAASRRFPPLQSYGCSSVLHAVSKSMATFSFSSRWLR